MLERDFQAKIIKTIEKKIPNCIILKSDANYLQGVPDLLILKDDKWAALEVKRDKNATHQENQDYYVEHMNNMSYASFIYPENFKEVMHELQQSFES